MYTTSTRRHIKAAMVADNVETMVVAGRIALRFTRDDYTVIINLTPMQYDKMLDDGAKLIYASQENTRG